jgi:hypothetical protein
MQYVKLLACCCMAIASFSSAGAQGFLKKVQNKANGAIDKAIDKKVDNAVNGDNQNGNGTNNGTNNNNNDGGSKGKPGNKTGGGLITTPPDIKENLGTAESAFKEAKYSDARYAVQQAILGVEMEIGKNILKSLPVAIGQLKADTTSDKVTSSGWGFGWAGLTIHRAYSAGEQQLDFTIANDAAWMQAVNMYLSNGGYAQTSSGGQQNWKQTKIKGYKAVIEFNQSSGYKLSVPLGQTSLLMYEGVNFATEQEFMKAAEQIDIDGIKKGLGEK